jgi:DNA gyrase subunit A
MEIGLVRRIDIDEEMQQSYLDYAMSVIVARALPDARDGLKPVHRRVLYAMYAMGIRPEGEFKKSARIVGEVLGKFHPHGDMAVYDAMARMAQEFSMRYTLVDGQGNFGSIDGDSPAAMRYTEAKIDPVGFEMLTDIEKETVSFVDNFDGTLLEPEVLPASVPNMLVNGSTGIAVGMSTSIPPHNLNEVVEALVYMLQNWKNLEDITVDELMKYIQGPDYPTGGILFSKSDSTSEGLAAAYGTGRGKIQIQASAHFEDMGRGRTRIIISELPFQTNKSNLIERIAEQARIGKIDGLTDLRDESDRQGMRIVIELSKNADPEMVLSQLYQRTPMQSTFSIIMLALVDGEPRLLNLKQALRVFAEHRLEIVRLRSEYDLARAKERAHILEGLLVALDNLDEVISLIRNSSNADQARSRLKRQYKLSDIQAIAILDMALRRLAGLEQKKIQSEYKSTITKIKSLEALLRSDLKMRNVVIEELNQVKQKFGDRRRTRIATTGKKQAKGAVLTATDMAPAKDTWIALTKDGRLSRSPSARLPRISGRDAPQLVIGASGQDLLYLFSRQGTGAAIPVHTLPVCDKPIEGNPLSALSPFSSEQVIQAGISLPPRSSSEIKDGGFLIFVTENGMVKKSTIEVLPGPSAHPFQAIKIAAKDGLSWILPSSGTDELMLFSSAGLAIRFSEDEVRPMGLSAAGVMGMRIGSEHKIVGAGLARLGADALLIASDGRGKRTESGQYPRQGRNGKGVLSWKSSDQSTIIGAAIGKSDDRFSLSLNRGAARSVRFGDVPKRARSSAGVHLFELAENVRVTKISPVVYRPDLKPLKAKEASGKAGKSRSSRSRSASKIKSRSRKGASARKKSSSSKKKSG